MKKLSFIISVLFLCLALAEACKKKSAALSATPIDFKVPAGWPPPVYNFVNNPLTVEGVELGRKLFYDGRLSKDGGFPCASCHQQIAAFGTYDHNLSHGYNNSHTLRNAPSLQNLAWHKLFNWDGASATIEQRSLQHISTAGEMGETVESILTKLRNDNTYPSMFIAAFGDATINAERLSKALTQFVLTIVSADSKYDKVMLGTAAFTLPEELGYNIFKEKCAVCHKEPLYTDLNFRNTGLPVDNFLKDAGRMRATNLSLDSLKFKVPSLRNADKTYPYGHDGRFFDIDAVLLHYRDGVIDGPTTDPLVNKKIPLTNFEIGQLKAFISTLTDTAFINNKRLGPF